MLNLHTKVLEAYFRPISYFFCFKRNSSFLRKLEIEFLPIFMHSVEQVCMNYVQACLNDIYTILCFYKVYAY